MKTKFTMLPIVLIALKFSVDGQRIKEEIFKLYSQQKKTSLQWVKIFKFLPIGMIVSKDNKII